jgi:Co/Zn/Cd efflux system component
VPENARRLTRIGTAIAAMELIRIATVMVVRAVPSFVGDKLPPISTQFILWISVAALFVLSQVFREGTRLRDEEKMTI